MNEKLKKQFKVTKAALRPDRQILPGLNAFYDLLKIFYEYMEKNMDREIRKIKKNVKKTEKDLTKLEKEDKKRDPACDLGKKIMKKKKKK